MNKRNPTFVTGLELAFFDYVSHFLMLQGIPIFKKMLELKQELTYK